MNLDKNNHSNDGQSQPVTSQDFQAQAITLSANEHQNLDGTLTLKNKVTILGAALFGVFLVLATNFSYQAVAHNAAHDTRHSIGFPCH